MDRAQEITQEELAEWFRSYYTDLCRYAYTIMQDQRQAEDLVQSLFVRLWEKRNELHIRENVRAYLYRSTYHHCLNEIKRIKRSRMQEISSIEDRSPSTELATDLVLSGELGERIERGLEQLPEKCAEVFRLSRQEELSYSEISDRLDISVKTVEKHIGKALKILRSELQEYLPEFLILIILNLWK